LRTSIRLAFIILVAVTNHGSLVGQEQPEPNLPDNVRDVEIADDWARWWTLTDELTPQELRAIHEDVELTRERYREAVNAGEKEFMPEERLARLDFYIDGSTHPELFQMWSVFDAFASGFEIPEVDPRASLAEFGFEGEVLDTIVSFSSDYWREKKILMERLMREAQPVLAFFRLGRESLGEEVFDAAYEAEDLIVMAGATGLSVDQVEEIIEAGRRTPADDYAAEALPPLKELLKPDDWDRFRSYLLKVKAPTMSGISTAVLGG
jgi:hypothetical protein